jgi:2-dehydropantoate 2-reductase
MRFAVMGAGSIGCYVGGRLQHGGHDVVFVGRQRLGAELAEHGLHLTSYRDEQLEVGALQWATTPDAIVDVDVVLVTVKGLATEEVAQDLARILPQDTVVLSLQNGVSNADILQRHLGSRRVWPCMVPFNVLRQGEGRFHQGTSGELTTSEEVPEPIRKALGAAGLEVRTHPDMRGVMWGKLLFNLNNALNALADLPLKEQLQDRVWRRVIAGAISEGLAVLAAEGITPVAFLPLPPWAVVHVLRLPTWLFTRVAKAMLAIDPDARSSMWEDLQRGRRTEVHMLNGTLVVLGRRHGVKTPINTAILEAIGAAERGEEVGDRVRALRALG